MDDLITFINARLDEDETAAYALGGTTWIVKGLDDYDYEIHVAYEPLNHALVPTEGIADVQREDVAEHMARYDPRRAQREVAAKRAIVALHVADRIEVINADHDERCGWFCTEDADGWPCPTVRYVATVWSDHPDYQQGWTQ